MNKHPFLIEALVDFPDDALHAEFPITHRHIDAMMKALAEGSPEAHACGRLMHPGGSLAWIDPFVVKYPHLRIKRRSDDGRIG